MSKIIAYIPDPIPKEHISSLDAMVKPQTWDQLIPIPEVVWTDGWMNEH